MRLVLRPCASAMTARHRICWDFVRNTKASLSDGFSPLPLLLFTSAMHGVCDYVPPIIHKQHVSSFMAQSLCSRPSRQEIKTQSTMIGDFVWLQKSPDVEGGLTCY